MPTEAPPNQTEEPTSEEAAERRADLRERAGDGEITKPVRYKWDEAQIGALRKTKAKECTPEEFVVFLEVAARYDLDPFAGQIYAAKIGGQTSVIVSRDGLLSFAHRQQDFEGMVGDVVRENDEFRVTFDNGVRQVHHVWGTTPSLVAPLEQGTHPDASPPPRQSDHPRGEIIGAWAEVHRKGMRPTFYYAERSEYDSKKSTWASKPSAMILKVAESMALRKSFSISGVVGEDEVAKERASLSSLPEEPDWGNDPDMAVALKQAVEDANELVPGSYRPPKVKALLQDADDERRTEVLRGIQEFILQEQATELES